MFIVNFMVNPKHILCAAIYNIYNIYTETTHIMWRRINGNEFL